MVGSCFIFEAANFVLEIVIRGLFENLNVSFLVVSIQSRTDCYRPKLSHRSMTETGGGS